MIFQTKNCPSYDTKASQLDRIETYVSEIDSFQVQATMEIKVRKILRRGFTEAMHTKVRSTIAIQHGISLGNIIKTRILHINPKGTSINPNSKIICKTHFTIISS
jgi:hypothetical protein